MRLLLIVHERIFFVFAGSLTLLIVRPVGISEKYPYGLVHVKFVFRSSLTLGVSFVGRWRRKFAYSMRGILRQTSSLVSLFLVCAVCSVHCPAPGDDGICPKKSI